MTFIEFFDKTHVENICSSLVDTPERVIFLGNDKKKMEKAVERYRKIFLKRGENIEFLSRSVSRSDLAQGIRVLSEIVEKYDNCVFDISGGEEMLILALGIILEKYKEKDIKIRKINFYNNSVYHCDKNGNTVKRETPRLTVEENIRLYGGEVSSEADDGFNMRWDMTPEFESDIDKMWRLNILDTAAWNRQMGVFCAMDKVGETDGLTTSVVISSLKAHFSADDTESFEEKRIIEGLVSEGLITSYTDDGYEICVTYKNKQVKKCLSKAGQILEMKIYKTIRNLKRDDGSALYNDVQTGVEIDWNGNEDVENNLGVGETKNEIDVLAMKNMIPVFISCKNGFFDADELYKLNTVAERFGDKYAKKILVSAGLSKSSRKLQIIMQRIRDMKINLIDITKDTDDKRLEDRLRHLAE